MKFGGDPMLVEKGKEATIKFLMVLKPIQ